mmetsp:Transcript_29562/g.49906  ORF Transcript_29562/g.49906 Transcript_29562/m.49906 type:complete len:241 (-) Transcript_29562:1487-2209(-)
MELRLAEVISRVGGGEVSNTHRPVGGDIGIDKVGLVVQFVLLVDFASFDGRESVSDGVLVVAGVKALGSVQVDVRRVVVGVLPVDHGEHIGLVEAVVQVCLLTGIVVAVLARDVAIERIGGVVSHDIVRDVRGVNVLGGETERGLRSVGGQCQGTFGGVDIVVVAGEGVGGVERVKQTEGTLVVYFIPGDGGVVPQHCVVAAVGLGGDGTHELDDVGIQLGTLVPVIHVLVVGGIEVSVS